MYSLRWLRGARKSAPKVAFHIGSVSRADTEPETARGELGQHLCLLRHEHRMTREGLDDCGPKQDVLGAYGGSGEEGDGVYAGATANQPRRRDAHLLSLLYICQNIGAGWSGHIGATYHHADSLTPRRTSLTHYFTPFMTASDWRREMRTGPIALTVCAHPTFSV